MSIAEQERDGMAPSSGGPRLAVLRGRNFRLLWIGEGVSLLGDQFYMIALPWLVLQLTGSAVAMGTVLALEGVPRALLMLVGGAVTDRVSARTVILGSYAARCAIVALLALGVITGTVQIWMIYAAGLLFGVADAFYFPAQGAIVPRVVEKEHLGAANMLTQGTAQLSLFVGPVLAGTIIALAGGSGGKASSAGISLALAVDALSFVAAAAFLALVRLQRSERETDESQSVAASIREGLRFVWRDPVLRVFFGQTVAINLLINGPFGVGIPLLAHNRFPQGSAAFGAIVSAYGGGLLLGTALAGVLPRPPLRRMGTYLLVVISSLGVGMALLGIAPTMLVAVAISCVMGAGNGYVIIIFITWLQQRTPEAMLGRMMSVLMLASLGLNPISNAAAGVVASISLTGLLVGAGALMTLETLLSTLHPATRSMELPADGTGP